MAPQHWTGSTIQSLYDYLLFENLTEIQNQILPFTSSINYCETGCTLLNIASLRYFQISHTIPIQKIAKIRLHFPEPNNLRWRTKCPNRDEQWTTDTLSQRWGSLQRSIQNWLLKNRCEISSLSTIRVNVKVRFTLYNETDFLIYWN